MRFASVDPIDGGDWNAYSYAAQDPINGMDLTGEMHIDGGGGRGCDARTCSKAAYDKRAKAKPKKKCRVMCVIKTVAGAVADVSASIGEAFAADNGELYVDAASGVAFAACAPAGLSIPCAGAVQVNGRLGLIAFGTVRGITRVIRRGWRR